MHMFASNKLSLSSFVLYDWIIATAEGNDMIVAILTKHRSEQYNNSLLSFQILNAFQLLFPITIQRILLEELEKKKKELSSYDAHSSIGVDEDSATWPQKIRTKEQFIQFSNHYIRPLIILPTTYSRSWFSPFFRNSSLISAMFPSSIVYFASIVLPCGTELLFQVDDNWILSQKTEFSFAQEISLKLFLQPSELAFLFSFISLSLWNQKSEDFRNCDQKDRQAAQHPSHNSKFTSHIGGLLLEETVSSQHQNDIPYLLFFHRGFFSSRSSDAMDKSTSHFGTVEGAQSTHTPSNPSSRPATFTSFSSNLPSIQMGVVPLPSLGAALVVGFRDSEIEAQFFSDYANEFQTKNRNNKEFANKKKESRTKRSEQPQNELGGNFESEEVHKVDRDSKTDRETQAKAKKEEESSSTHSVPEMDFSSAAINPQPSEVSAFVVPVEPTILTTHQLMHLSLKHSQLSSSSSSSFEHFPRVFTQTEFPPLSRSSQSPTPDDVSTFTPFHSASHSIDSPSFISQLPDVNSLPSTPLSFTSSRSTFTPLPPLNSEYLTEHSDTVTALDESLPSFSSLLLGQMMSVARNIDSSFPSSRNHPSLSSFQSDYTKYPSLSDDLVSSLDKAMGAPLPSSQPPSLSSTEPVNQSIASQSSPLQTVISPSIEPSHSPSSASPNTQSPSQASASLTSCGAMPSLSPSTPMITSSSSSSSLPPLPLQPFSHSSSAHNSVSSLLFTPRPSINSQELSSSSTSLITPSNSSISPYLPTHLSDDEHSECSASSTRNHVADTQMEQHVDNSISHADSLSSFGGLPQNNQKDGESEVNNNSFPHDSSSSHAPHQRREMQQIQMHPQIHSQPTSSFPLPSFNSLPSDETGDALFSDASSVSPSPMPFVHSTQTPHSRPRPRPHPTV
ncbi:uncharacterized protein MONOS_517 [Monocercomonoides exilis]|uniref:uncharacterized protein n=1 Tax=Monocercomonoides exilis TaxID=2049356 RepID=UPI0035598E35|nr:hypothetical protein MONOS_517 [Monocercomonoides exilis]|eukprot:MONOS_517.1-p1 / transcript=MONOS_517.1 / gene=MONOS_517 / organism=Monocercomonoides_exilis_PA203 / gene_product=unspecified product / transcript_product=unspecified product / location=Mono_scaffold00008:137234-139936(+) / protein_length=901 / sequence_SO=supercontig / SO=protein_coding / is_pseudo=false